MNLKNWFSDLRNTHLIHVVLVETVSDLSEEKQSGRKITS